ncbi:MAG: CDP-glucose 4,6-dehydratase [Mycobacterium sp.]
MSERLGCKAVGLARSTYRRIPFAQTPADPDAELREWLRGYSAKHPCHGFRRAWAALRHDERRDVNKKKVHRLWKLEGLQRRVHSLRKRAGQSSWPAEIAADAPKVVWALDFQFDSTIDGKAIKIASMLDEHTRESLLNIVERSITANRLIAELEKCFAAAGGPPMVLRMDNGPELISQALQSFCAGKVGMSYIPPGAPWELVCDFRVDIRDAEDTAAAVSAAAPDVVVHMAAQSLVRESYRKPRDTYEINAIGTLSVLEAVAATPSVRAHVVVTTDKVYRNIDQEAGYVETDPLGGDDPYSASKAMADLLAQSWIRSFPGSPTAIARAGNVIGGGDVSRDRLLPDLTAAYARGEEPRLRFPRAVRPWQHVLDCLNGYLTLADALLAGSGLGQWNFGPGRDSVVEVGQVATLAAELWGGGAHWELDGGHHPHEANLLALDTSKAQRELGWCNRLGFRDALAWTIDWERRVHAGGDPLMVSREQIAAFESVQ